MWKKSTACHAAPLKSFQAADCWAPAERSRANTARKAPNFGLICSRKEESAGTFEFIEVIVLRYCFVGLNHHWALTPSRNMDSRCIILYYNTHILHIILTLFFGCKVIPQRWDCSSSRRDWNSTIQHCTLTRRHDHCNVLLTPYPGFPFLSSYSALWQICAIHVFFFIIIFF